jgi:hypothetical protein
LKQETVSSGRLKVESGRLMNALADAKATQKAANGRAQSNSQGEFAPELSTIHFQLSTEPSSF